MTSVNVNVVENTEGGIRLITKMTCSEKTKSARLLWLMLLIKYKN